jgi:hypothetical protein
MTSVQRLARCVAEPGEDDDGTEAYEAAVALAASGDRSALPDLYELLARYLDGGDFFGRDMVAVAIAGIAGVESLPVLLRAAARDLGDDQDGLSAEIWGAMSAAPCRAREIIGQLGASPDARLRAKAFWAAQFLPDAAD